MRWVPMAVVSLSPLSSNGPAVNSLHSGRGREREEKKEKERKRKRERAGVGGRWEGGGERKAEKGVSERECARERARQTAYFIEKASFSQTQNPRYTLNLKTGVVG